MGDPRKTKKNYQTPGHPWNAEGIAREKTLLKEYSLKNKKEIWKMESVLRNAKAQAKKLSRTRSEQARLEEDALLTKLKSMGILQDDATLDSILALEMRIVLERRLQTLVFKQMLANSMKQARQYITHGHISVNGKTITAPSHLVSMKEAGLITFHEKSALSDPEHPERVSAKRETPEEMEVKARAKDKDASDAKATKKAATPKNEAAEKKEAPAEENKEAMKEEKAPEMEAPKEEPLESPEETKPAEKPADAEVQS